MQIDYIDMSGVDRTLTVGVAMFEQKRTPNTHYAKVDRRDRVEITHLGIEHGFTFKVPHIVESELAAIRQFDLAVANCNTFTVTDPENTMPEFTFPITLVRAEGSLPVLLRKPPCKQYSYSVNALVVS